MTSDLDRPETGAEWTRLHGARRPFHAALAAGVLLVLAFLIGGVAIVLEHTRRTALNAAELELDRSTKVAQSLFNRHMLQVDSALVSLPVMLGEVVAGEDGARRRRVRYWSALALLRCVSSSPAASMPALRARSASVAPFSR